MKLNSCHRPAACTPTTGKGGGGEEDEAEPRLARLSRPSPAKESIMSYARQMLDTSPGTAGVDTGALAAAIDAAVDCAQACAADTDADLGEHNRTEMVRCIRLCLHCADVCTATAGVLSRPAEYDPGVTRPLLEACVAICSSCGDECE